MLARFQRPWLVPLLIGLLAAQPLFSGRLIQGADALLHYYRVIALDELWRAGVVYSRWFPNLAFGYGYPIFQYYAPLAHLLAGGLHAVGLTFAQAINGAFIAAFCIGSLGVWHWLRQWLGHWPAVAGAAAYAFAPYTLYNLTERAALAEALALAFVPWGLSFARLQAQGHTRIAFGGLVAACAGVFLSHNITALLAMPVIAVYALVSTWHLHGLDARALARVGLPIALAVGCTTFFWLPALAERDLTHLERALTEAYDFRRYFVMPGMLIAGPQPFDVNRVNNILPTSLSWPALVASLFGLGSMLRRRADACRADVVFAFAVFCAFLIMTQAFSRQIWEWLPLVHFVEFAWRFLGIGSLALAALAGTGLARLGQIEPVNKRVAVVFIAICCVYGWAWQTPRFHSEALPSTADAIAAAERQLGIIGSTSIGEYVPRTVFTLPPDDAPRADKLMRSLLVPDATVVPTQLGALDWRYDIDAPRPHTITLAQFLYEGWRADINGVEIPLLADANGRMQLALPAGSYATRIWFGSNSLRDLANGVSVASLVLSLAALATLRIRKGPRTPEHSGANIVVIATLAALFGAKALLVDRGLTPIQRSLLPPTPPGTLTFEGALEVAGADAALHLPEANAVRAGVYWKLGERPRGDVSVGLKVVDARGATVGQHDFAHPGGDYPTSRWAATDYAHDVHNIPLNAGTPPGRYEVRAFAYPFGRPDQRLRASAERVPGEAQVATVEIGRPARQAQPEGIRSEIAIDREVAPGLILAGADLPVREIERGNFLPVDVIWHLRDASTPPASGRVCFEIAQLIAGCDDFVPGFPIVQWASGDTWRATHRLRVPETAVIGPTDLSLVIEEQRFRVGPVTVKP